MVCWVKKMLNRIVTHVHVNQNLTSYQAKIENYLKEIDRGLWIETNNYLKMFLIILGGKLSKTGD